MGVAKDRVFILPINKLEWLVPFIKQELSEYNNSTKNQVVLVTMMPEDVSQCTPSLQTPVDSLVSCTSHSHCLQMIPVLGLEWCAALGVSLVAFVGDHFFQWFEFVSKFAAEDGDIRT